jgi:ABC-2 type transport system ATP-binding protein
VLRLNRERGMSIIYTSHYMEEVELLCSRVAIIDQGEIIAMDTVKNLVATLGGGIIYVGVPIADDDLIAQIGALPAVKEASLVPRPVAPPPSQGEGVEEKELTPVAAGDVVKIVASKSQQAIVNVIGFLNEHDIALTSLEILEPNLESVFLHLTGKKLRE